MKNLVGVCTLTQLETFRAHTQPPSSFQTTLLRYGVRTGNTTNTKKVCPKKILATVLARLWESTLE